MRDTAYDANAVAMRRGPLTQRRFQGTAADKERAPGHRHAIEHAHQQANAFFLDEAADVTDDRWIRRRPVEADSHRLARGWIGSKTIDINTKRHYAMRLAAITACEHGLHYQLPATHPSGAAIDAILFDRGKRLRVVLRDILRRPEDQRDSARGPPRHLAACGNVRLLPAVHKVPRLAQQRADSKAVNKHMKASGEMSRYGFDVAWLAIDCF